MLHVSRVCMSSQLAKIFVVSKLSLLFWRYHWFQLMSVCYCTTWWLSLPLILTMTSVGKEIGLLILARLTQLPWWRHTTQLPWWRHTTQLPWWRHTTQLTWWRHTTQLPWWRHTTQLPWWRRGGSRDRSWGGLNYGRFFRMKTTKLCTHKTPKNGTYFT